MGVRQIGKSESHGRLLLVRDKGHRVMGRNKTALPRKVKGCVKLSTRLGPEEFPTGLGALRETPRHPARDRAASRPARAVTPDRRRISSQYPRSTTGNPTQCRPIRTQNRPATRAAQGRTGPPAPHRAAQGHPRRTGPRSSRPWAGLISATTCSCRLISHYCRNRPDQRLAYRPACYSGTLR